MKKNRFSMLETEGNDKQTSSGPTDQDNKSANQEDLKNPKQFKVIVDDDEFKKNLSKHQLKEKIQTIEKKKIDIKIETKSIRIFAYLKITIGVLIIIAALKKYYVPTRRKNGEIKYTGDGDLIIEYIDAEMTSQNYIILLVMVIISIYIYLHGKTKGKK